MKRRITENIVNGLRSLKRSLSPKLFSENLSLQIKNYELNSDFISEFEEYLNMDELSSYSLSPECIKYLDSNNKFNYDIWLNDVDMKNVDILVDDEFIEKHNVDIVSILSKAKLITTPIYLKYINFDSPEVRKNILLNYDGPELTVSKIMDNFDILDQDLFKLPKVLNELKSGNTDIEDRILNSTKPINIIVLMTLMQKIYIQNEVNDKIDDLLFKDLDLTENNPKANDIISHAQNMLSNIIEKYSTEVVSKLIQNIFYVAEPVLLNSNLLKQFLVSCDDIPEDLLTSISSVFIMTNTRTELLNYARNHNYETTVALLALS